MSKLEYNPDYDTGTGVIPNQLKAPRGTFNFLRDLPPDLQRTIYDEIDDFKAEKLIELRNQMDEIKEEISEEEISIFDYSPSIFFPTTVTVNELDAHLLVESSENMLRDPFVQNAPFYLSTIETATRALAKIEKNKIKATDEIYKEVQIAAREYQKMNILTRQIRDFTI